MILRRGLGSRGWVSTWREEGLARLLLLLLICLVEERGSIVIDNNECVFEFGFENVLVMGFIYKGMERERERVRLLLLLHVMEESVSDVSLKK